jgi:CBS-domain-containing membrane protein
MKFLKNSPLVAFGDHKKRFSVGRADGVVFRMGVESKRKIAPFGDGVVILFAVAVAVNSPPLEGANALRAFAGVVILFAVYNFQNVKP